MSKQGTGCSIVKALSNALYKIGRKTGKIATTLNDVDALLSGDPKKIVKRVARKEIYKASNKITKNISNKFR